MNEMMFEVNPPYNFDRVLERLSLDPLNCVNQGERWVKIPYYGEQDEVITVQALGDTDYPKFKIFFSENSNREAQSKHIHHIFKWDTALSDIQVHFLKTDLKPIFEKHLGTPLVLEFNPYASIIKSIIHQQLNLSFAHTLTKRFVEKYGRYKEGVWFYPRPEEAAEIPVEELRELQFSQRKAEYVIGFSEKVASGELNLEELSKKSDEEIIKELVKIRGIGPWTAENFLLFALGRPNLFPKADIGIQNAVKKIYGMDRKPTIEELEKWSFSWHPYLSYASLYLWRSIE
ncbi:DNA-3-methyladenine glycosylase II [Bacillus pakistanensis]|uniref:DNA-3-methyladenine glycosylase II n=1 Tax=Rossellomorea pakistanensis TaxID=992288 RepID=A0ABS2NI67_9BACI|nr:DNA-3-methyladenine glycosylase [Bacillus pakistanensis]MBM7587519.1 DNA-3-methyladenine glycosylase II [Bacillus pakistanensis]